MQRQTETIAGLLYDGVLAPDAWHKALDGMCRQVDAGIFHYFTLGNDYSCADVPTSVGNLESAGLHAEKMREYEIHHASNDVRMAVAMRMSVGQVMLDHEHISQRELSRNSVCAGWLIPLGFRHTLAVSTRMEAGVRDFLSFMRPRDSRPYGVRDKTFLDQLMPDLQRAARLRARMGQLSRHAFLGLAALDSLPQGMAVVDAQCRIHYANPAAERVLAPPGALRTVHGRLQCTQGAFQAQWQHLVAGACTSPGKAGAFELAGSVQHADRLAVTVLPLKASHTLASFRQVPMALVVLAVPGAMAALDHRLVSGMLGLSAAETRLLLLLAMGKTVKDYATIERCSWHTARTHLKNLMRKTGCHRQVEVVQLVQALRVG